MFKRRSGFDVFGGLVLCLSGVLVMVQSTQYPLGRPTQMGPGFYPMLAGGLLILLGVLISLFVDEVERSDERPVIRSRTLIAVFSSLLVWAVLLESFGLIPATVALVVVAAAAYPRPNLKRVAITAVALPFLGWALFIEGLGLPMAPLSW